MLDSLRCLGLGNLLFTEERIKIWILQYVLYRDGKGRTTAWASKIMNTGRNMECIELTPYMSNSSYPINTILSSEHIDKRKIPNIVKPWYSTNAVDAAVLFLHLCPYRSISYKYRTINHSLPQRLDHLAR